MTGTATLLHTRPQQLVLGASERTLLRVVIPAKCTEPIAVRLTVAVGEMLRTIGVAETVVKAELAAMVEMTISTTASRTVLGSMNDFALMLESHLLRCSPIGMNTGRSSRSTDSRTR